MCGLLFLEFLLVAFLKIKSVLHEDESGYSSSDLAKKESKSKQRAYDLKQEMKQREKMYSDAHSGDESIFNR
jgi:hypothetical protein